jgi:hypothetical protein
MNLNLTKRYIINIWKKNFWSLFQNISQSDWEKIITVGITKVTYMIYYGIYTKILRDIFRTILSSEKMFTLHKKKKKVISSLFGSKKYRCASCFNFCKLWNIKTAWLKINHNLMNDHVNVLETFGIHHSNIIKALVTNE